MRTSAKQMALGGMMTAVSVVIMCMGSLIPVNTYICPVLCILITRVVLSGCGRRMALCYYLAVALLSLMLAPDREAALVYAFLGYYPLIRPWFGKLRHRWLELTAKVVFFTIAGAAAYGALMLVMGMDAFLVELEGAGVVMLAVLVVFWDVLFVLADRLLGLPLVCRKR